MKRTVFSTGRTFIGRIPAGIDLLEAITRIANEEEIKAGTVQVFGSVTGLSLTTFNQETRFNEEIRRDTGHDIAALSGTISQFKRRSLARLSGVFVNSSGETVAGTLALGTTVHACEAVITEFTGGQLSRDFDMETGLPLWKNNTMLVESPAEDS